MKRQFYVGWAALLLGLATLVLVGCPGDPPPPPVPVSVDAPELAASLKFVGVCAVCCSALGAAALIIASQRRK